MNSQLAELWSNYIESRSIEIRNQLVEKYMRLVYFELSKTNAPIGFEREDMLQFGTIGLINAIDKCDLEKIDKFENYALIRIRGEIMDALRVYIKNTQGISRDTLMKIKEIEKAKKEIIEITKDTVSDIEIMKHLNMNEIEYNKLQLKTIIYNGVSLEEYNESPADSPENIEKDYLRDETYNEIINSLPLLKDKEEFVIREHYLNNKPFNALAVELGVSFARVSQIHYEAIKQLRLLVNKE